MHPLQSSSDPEDKVWDTFMAGNISCQKTDIPGTAIGRDHAGEQENCKIKNRGGIKGITTARQDTFLLPQFFVRNLK